MHQEQLDEIFDVLFYLEVFKDKTKQRHFYKNGQDEEDAMAYTFDLQKLIRNYLRSLDFSQFENLMNMVDDYFERTTK